MFNSLIHWTHSCELKSVFVRTKSWLIFWVFRVQKHTDGRQRTSLVISQELFSWWLGQVWTGDNPIHWIKEGTPGNNGLILLCFMFSNLNILHLAYVSFHSVNAIYELLLTFVLNPWHQPNMVQWKFDSHSGPNYTTRLFCYSYLKTNSWWWCCTDIPWYMYLQGQTFVDWKIYISRTSNCFSPPRNKLAKCDNYPHILRPPNLYNGGPYTDKRVSVHWDGLGFVTAGQRFHRYQSIVRLN